VESSLRSYTFHEEPDVGYLEGLLEAARRSLLPEGSAREAVVA
jgi:hypothetical protein